MTMTSPTVLFVQYITECTDKRLLTKKFQRFFGQLVKLRSHLLYGERRAAVESILGYFCGGRTTAVRRPYGRSQYFRGRRLAVEF